MRRDKDWESKFRQALYRPFDFRTLFYADYMVDWPRAAVMSQMLRSNLSLCVGRAGSAADNQKWNIVFVANTLVDMNLFYRGGNVAYPLRFAAPSVGLVALNRTLRPNFKTAFLKALSSTLGVPRSDHRNLPVSLSPEEVIWYIYAVFHSLAYRRRFAEFLKIDFPRLPLTGSLELFRALARLGGELVALHLMESPKLDHFITIYAGPRKPEVGRVGWSDDTVWLDAAATKKGQPAMPGTVGFRGVPESVWNFHIGGYQVCEKWLKDRKGRTLSDDDIAHYQKIIVALAETIRLMDEIDEVIEHHGGWPGAFAQGEAKPQGAGSEAADSDNVVPLSALTTASPVSQAELLPLSEAAEPEAPPYEAAAVAGQGVTRRGPDELDREELICRIRQMFSDGENRTQDAATGVLARDLGYQHPDSRIHEDLDAALRIAVGRGILANHNGALRLAARNIDHYQRSFLKEQFLASLLGRPWIERDDAIRAFARWMGFRRTGQTIDDTARSLINGLVREKHVERDGSRIRKTP